ncbi:LOW QUALITY PROTEIN: ribonuclease H2 subunit A-like [Amphiura filiformis]|uniref:LOW QUALITY PROTEIN: ribonuclease H2 subunit A-like n=1 Tax=Amphiura filiformis TaxID=82378 RepID=UPI003B20CCD5
MDFSPYEENNSVNKIFKSAVPQICKDEPCLFGIDEAGRGPVLGPMVYGISYCPISMKETLEKKAFADSKTLKEEVREDLFSQIQECNDFMGFEVDILSPNYISTTMLRRTKYSLNQISMDSAIGLLRLAIADGVQVKEVYVDTVGDAQKYQDKLKGLFPDLEITVTPKADSKFAIVSAASICAKVVRDKVVKSWQFPESIDVSQDQLGSGYPSDPTTKRFLADNVDPVFGFPRIVRFSWSTASKILDEKAVPVQWDDDEEIDESAKGTASITSFFAPKGANPRKKKHQFFNDRHISQVTSF